MKRGIGTLRVALISLAVTLFVLFARDALIVWDIQQALNRKIQADRAERIARRAEQLWQQNYYTGLARRPHHWFWNTEVGMWAYGPVQPMSEFEIERDRQVQMPYYLRLAAEQERANRQ